MLSLGSVSREEAARKWDFLAADFRGCRDAIYHADVDCVFWIKPRKWFPDVVDVSVMYPPRCFKAIPGYEGDEPHYGVFPSGIVASRGANQLIIVYCGEEALSKQGIQLEQFLQGVTQIPIRITDEALVITDNGDIYGTLVDLIERQLSVSSKNQNP